MDSFNVDPTRGINQVVTHIRIHDPIAVRALTLTYILSAESARDLRAIHGRFRRRRYEARRGRLVLPHVLCAGQVGNSRALHGRVRRVATGIVGAEQVCSSRAIHGRFRRRRREGLERSDKDPWADPCQSTGLVPLARRRVVNDPTIDASRLAGCIASGSRS